MPKGILKLRKSNKGSIIVELDRLNGKPPMPLSYISFKDTAFNDKECEFNFDNGTFIGFETSAFYTRFSNKIIKVEENYVPTFLAF